MPLTRTIRIPEETYQNLHELAEREGCTESELASRAIAFLDLLGEEEMGGLDYMLRIEKDTSTPEQA